VWLRLSDVLELVVGLVLELVVELLIVELLMVELLVV
jgi:hypothetical protein